MSYIEGIPLLQYVDDTTFFMYGLVEEVRSLSTLLDLFIFFSGLQIIYAKSLLWALDYTRNRRYNAQRLRNINWESSNVEHSNVEHILATDR